MPSAIGRLSKILFEKPRVITRAIFWKIPHNTKESEINLKLGRYNKTKNWSESLETLDPKSELTLNDEEFKSLIKLLQENYKPFKDGVKAYIPLDKPFESGLFKILCQRKSPQSISS